MATLLRIDKNGTKYWTESKCEKCGGTGYIDYYKYNCQGVCFNCGGTGYKVRNWKEYTPEYAKKLEERRIARLKKTAPERNAKFLKKEGFSEDGKAWVVLGNTYEIKDELKASGCKWNNLLGWHFNHEVADYETFMVTVDDVMSIGHDGHYFWKAYSDVVDFIDDQKKANAPKTESQYVGEIGETVEMNLTLANVFTYKTHFTYSGETNYIYKFTDAEGNTLIWKTGKPLHIETGNAVTVKGTIKEHSEYNGDKQTVLTRCKVKGVN